MGNNPFSKELKKFSVIAPVYKDAYKVLPKFFNALNQQDYKEFEVIVVFDGANPAGVKMLKKQQALYPGITVKSLTIEHGGAPKARNAGADIAEGDYLTFLDPDVYPLSETFREWANAFELHPEKDVIWGIYSFINGDKAYSIGDSVPKDPKGNPDYWAFRFTNYCSGMFPMRKEAFVRWDETVKSLQDWDMWIRMLKKDDFKGERFHYIPKSFCITEPVQEGGISSDSHNNWKERVAYVRDKNDIPRSKICVCSIGAPWHGLHAARKLGADYLPMPSFKEHDYDAIYLLGFYPGAGGPTKQHLSVFAEPGHLRSDERGLPDVQQYFKGVKIIHWIGTDVLKMRTEVPFVTLKFFKELWEKEGFIQLSEAPHIQEELEEIGIANQVVPIPPDKLYTPMALPEEFSVAIYENPTQNLYYNSLMEQVARAMPDVKFYFFGDITKEGKKYRNVAHLGWIDLDEWLPKFSCNLRVTIHDGLPLTPLQFMTAGRHAITSTKLEGAFQVEADRKQIIEAIRIAERSPINDDVSKYWLQELDFTKYVTTMEALCTTPKSN